MYAYTPDSVGVVTVGEHVRNEKNITTNGHGIRRSSGPRTD
jgi:hypothetical protein